MGIYWVNFMLIIVYGCIYKVAIDLTRQRHMVDGAVNVDEIGQMRWIRHLFVGAVTLQLVLLLALRGVSVGVDLDGYLYSYRMFESWHFIENNRFEVGYKYLNYGLQQLRVSEQLFMGLVALLSLWPIGRMIGRYSAMPVVSFLLFVACNFYSFTFSGLRQAIAFSLIVWSFDFILRRKLFGFLLLVAVGALFHQSALVFLPAYWVWRVRLNKVVLVGAVLLGCVLYWLRLPIFGWVVGHIVDGYAIVQSSSYNWMLLGCAVFLCGVFVRSFGTLEENRQVLLNGQLMFVLVALLIMIFASVGNNVLRVADYYYLFVVLLVPEMLAAVKEPVIRAALVIGVVVGVFLLYGYFLLEDGYGIVPYTFFWAG